MPYYPYWLSAAATLMMMMMIDDDGGGGDDDDDDGDNYEAVAFTGPGKLGMFIYALRYTHPHGHIIAGITCTMCIMQT